MGPTPLTVAPNWLVEAGAGVEEMDAAVRPAKTTSMAKMRTISFIFGDLSTFGMTGFSYPESPEC